MPRKHIRISHRGSRTTLAEGPVGWGITPFEGNYYISRKFLRTRGFKPNYIPGLCPYKFLYVWMDLDLENGEKVRNLGWLYWLPNPLFPDSGRVRGGAHAEEAHSHQSQRQRDDAG